MSDVKLVKVDNWGIYFLQRLKHFFNRTDYCDLTLQFQDNAQLKVHRLVLNACTEYFELLERTCEMYEDCLVMPDDLQADVVVPIVNFMYTGHLEFRMDLLERLYQTSQILNMPVLSKLLESHRNLAPKPTVSYSGIRKSQKLTEKAGNVTPANATHKRSYSKAFGNVIHKETKKSNIISAKSLEPFFVNCNSYHASSSNQANSSSQRINLTDPRPTRYELPDELDNGNVFDNSFTSISYTSQPLMIHPDTVKSYSSKRTGIFKGTSLNKSGISTGSKSIKEDNIFDDDPIPEQSLSDETDIFQTSFSDNVHKDSNQLFDQIIDQNDGPKVTIETKDSKAASNLDHARIISEVLKKYPHLVKSNKNIKLKILETPSGKPRKMSQKLASSPMPSTSLNNLWYEEKGIKLKTEEPDFTYETNVIDSKLAAKLIALGAENIKGPWICLICGTPGKALHFTSYYKFRRHLVEVHNEKPVSNICEYCGLRSSKRNYLLHHLYAQHGVPPPPQYHFPKCNQCNYVALNETLLIKHKMTHKTIKNFRCNVCSAAFASSSQLLLHIQSTGHKYSSERKNNLQCIYCMRVFLRETNLYAHIISHHKKEAMSDGIIENSDDDEREENVRTKSVVKLETTLRKSQNVANSTQKILNAGFETNPKLINLKLTSPEQTPEKSIQTLHNNSPQELKYQTHINPEEVIIIDNKEYIMRDNQIILKKPKTNNVSNMTPVINSTSLNSIIQPTTSIEYADIQNTSIEQNSQQPSRIIKKSGNIGQPIQIVVSSAEEYKALMASNHPIIFDNEETNKTLSVLSSQHESMEATAMDYDHATPNEMMIIPDQFPLNVSDGITNENSNIVVVYSHATDDNKQYQILTSGGIGTQFVQPSAIITENYETVTTSTPGMSEHCIETEVEQTWQDNIQSMQGQHIQLPPVKEIQSLLSDPQDIKTQGHNAPENSLNDLAEIHLVSEPQTLIPSQTETVMSVCQQSVNIDQINHIVVQNSVEVPQSISETLIDPNFASECVNSNEMSIITVTSDPQHTNAEITPIILTNNETCVMEEQITEDNDIIPTETETIFQSHMKTDDTMQQSLETENTIEPIVSNPIQPMETESVIEAVENINVQQQPMEIIMQTMDVEDTCAEETEANITEGEVNYQIIEESDQVMESENDQVMESNNDQIMETENDQLKETENDQVIITENQQVVLSNNEESVITENQIMTSENDFEQIQNVAEQIDTGNVVPHTDTENYMQQNKYTENVIEDIGEAECIEENAGHAENITEEPEKSENVVEQAMEPLNIILHQTMPLNNIVADQDSNENENTKQNQEIELTESQEYEDIAINQENIDEPVYAKEAEGKIQHLTSEWSEDEYDVNEDDFQQNTQNIPNEVAKNMAEEEKDSELEESIENIQQEMKKHISIPSELGGETEESAASSQEDSSSQEPQLADSPANTGVPDPEAVQKISTLLNDWEDNDSQEESVTDTENTVVSEDKNTNQKISEESVQVTNNDPIKSLVSDWDDDDDDDKE